MQLDMDDFILAMHDASMHLSPDEFSRWALTEVRRQIDFDFAIWGSGDGQRRDLSQALILDQSDYLFDTWEAVKKEDPFANLVIGNTGKTWSIDQLPDFRESKAYREHWGLYCAQQMVSTMEVDKRTGLHVFVTLARDSERSWFKRRDLRHKSMLTKHLFLAARHNDMHFLRSKQAPAALLDHRGYIHAALPSFTELLANTLGAAARYRLPESVNRLLWAGKRYRGNGVSLHAENLSGRLLVRAAVCTGASLSAREEEVAWLYASGSSHKEVAASLGVSPTTVRTHLARVYQKLEVSSKGALALWLKDNS